MPNNWTWSVMLEGSIGRFLLQLPYAIVLALDDLF